MAWPDFSQAYCDRQEATPELLAAKLQRVREKYQPTGFLLLENVVLERRHIGQRVILPYGPNNTFKEPPTDLVRVNDRSSGYSTVIGTMLAEDVPGGNDVR